MNSKIFFAFFFLLWCFSYAADVQLAMKPALFFDWGEKKLLEMNTQDDQTNCFVCLSACPRTSTSAKEKLIDEEVSITGNGTFLQTFHEDFVYADETEINICETSPKPALVWDILGKYYEIGYELYYEEGDLEEAECLWYRHFRKVIKGEINFSSSTTSNESRIKIHENMKNTKFELVDYPGKKMVFYWISVLFIESSPPESSGKQRMVIFTKDTVNDYFHQLGKPSQCIAYYSGDGRYIIDQNHPAGQEAINRLVKTQIIPMFMFHTLPARLATCMYLNVAFIWQTIANGQMITIDLFLYGLYREAPSEINISFGVNGDANKRDEITSEDEIFLKYPVPEILFRIIQYTFNGELYGVAVIIHNNAQTIQDTNRICNTSVEGWDHLINSNAATGISYVCSLTSEVVRKLGFDESKKDLSTAQPLELNKFPRLNKGKKGISFDNLAGKIQDKLNQFKKWNMADFSKKFH